MNKQKYSPQIKTALTSLLLAPAISSGVVIYSETFDGTDGSVSSLNGVSIGAETWSTNGFATDNGVLQTGQFEGSAVLPFIPAVNTTYTLSLDVISSSNRWVGLGFASSATTSEIANRPQDRFAQNDVTGRSWFIFRPIANSIAEEAQIFGGPTTSNGIADTDLNFDETFTGVRTLSIILDTTGDGSSYQADYLIDGVSLLPSGPATINAALSTIAGVGFTFEGPTGGATTPITVDNFLLEQTVPEPSTALLGALGALGLMRRRRA